MPLHANLELTTIEKKALAFYREHVTLHGKAPSVRSLAAHIEMSPMGAHRLLVRLGTKGYIAFREEVARVTRTRLTMKGKKAAL